MDECDPETRHELVDALELFLKSSKKPVKIFISSRPDTTLENQLKSSPSVGIQASDNQGDIEKFIHVELDRLVTATPFLEKLKPEIVAKLLERSQGMFQWVSLQLTRIGKSNRPAKVRTCLDTLPGSLKEAYDQVWREIETQEELADQTLIKRAFLWVSSACKPMTSDELLWAVRVSPTEGPLSLEDEIDEQGLLSLCHNLLIIDSQFKVWRFAHLSVREYIEKEKGWTLPQANLHTASVSLLLLSNTYEKVDPDTVSDPSGQPPNLDDLFDLSHPFQIYTRHHWALHIRALGQAEEMILAPILKAFLGSPEESSLQYRRWHTQIQNDRNQPSTSMFDHFSGSRKPDISPAHIPIFAMCRFGFDSILWDWWESTEISLASMSESGLCLLSLAALAGSMPICNLLVKRGMDVNRRLTKSSFYGSPLAAAAGTGRTEVVKFLVLEAGAEVNAQLENLNYGSVLAIAAAEGHVEVVKFLVREAKADVNLPLPYPYGQYGSALVAACKAEDIEICKILVQEGKANVNMQFESGSDGSAIAAAAFMAPIEVVKYLVREGGADVHVPVTIGRHGSVIEIAAARDRFDVVKFLVEEAAVDVNTPSQAGNWGSPLAAAAVHNRDDIARYLILEAGADVDMPLSHGPYGTALMAAAKGGTTEIFMLFLENSKAGVHTQLPYGNYGSVLVAAAPRRNFEILKWLIQEKGVDVNAPLEHGEYGSALAAAASERYSIECVKYLTQEAGADVNKQLFHGEYGSALAVAASSWMTFETVKYLVHEAGADVNMPLQTGEFGSVLARVIQSDSLKTVKFLVQEGGANVDMPLARGFFGSALATAAAIADGDLTMVKFLVEEGKADVNLPLQNGKFGSALTTAVVGEEIEVVKYLIESKADVNQRLPDGKRGSALAAAASLGEKEAADILINAGAEVNLKLEGAPFGSALQAALADISDEDRMFLELRGDSEESLKEKKAEIAELLRRHGATF